MAFTIHINDQLFAGADTSYKTVEGESGVYLFDKATLRSWIFYVKGITGDPATYNLMETHNDKLGVSGTTDWSTATTLSTGIENCTLDTLQEQLTNMLIVTYVKKNGTAYELWAATSTPAQGLGDTWTHAKRITIT